MKHRITNPSIDQVFKTIGNNAKVEATGLYVTIRKGDASVIFDVNDIEYIEVSDVINIEHIKGHLIISENKLIVSL